MKTILTTITFAIAVMVFAFNVNPAMAKEERPLMCQVGKWYEPLVPCDQVAEIDEIEDSDQTGSEIADSGEEGSTSAAGAQ